MKEEEAIHYLKVLVEMDLYPKHRLMKEGNLRNLDDILDELINSFENQLPEYLKQIQNYHEIVINILQEIDKHENEVAKTREQEER